GAAAGVGARAGGAAAPPAAAPPVGAAGAAPARELALEARALQASLSWSLCWSRHLASIPRACGTVAQNLAMSSLHSAPPVVRISVIRVRQLTDSSPSCSHRHR